MHWENRAYIFYVRQRREWKQKREKEKNRRTSEWQNWDYSLYNAWERAKVNADSARKIHTKEPQTHFEQRPMCGLIFIYILLAELFHLNLKFIVLLFDRTRKRMKKRIAWTELCLCWIKRQRRGRVKKDATSLR